MPLSQKHPSLEKLTLLLKKFTLLEIFITFYITAQTETPQPQQRPVMETKENKGDLRTGAKQFTKRLK